MLKVTVTSLCLGLVCLYLTADAFPVGSMVSGDIVVRQERNGSVYCDSMICSKETLRCRVTKQTETNDLNIIIRRRVCFGENNKIIKEESVKEKNKYQGNVNIVVDSGTGGSYITEQHEMTPEEKKKLDETLKKMNEQLEENRKRMEKQQKELMEYLKKMQEQIYANTHKNWNWNWNPPMNFGI